MTFSEWRMNQRDGWASQHGDDAYDCDVCALMP